MSQILPFFSFETYEDVIEIARMDVDHALHEAACLSESQVERITAYLYVYAIHMAARLGFNSHLNGCYKNVNDCLPRIKELLEIEYVITKERHEDGKYFSMGEMHNGATGKIRRH